MKKLDLRIKDNPQIWAKVPRKADDAFDYFYVKLIEENEKITALTDKISCGPYDEPVRKKLRPAQKVLAPMWDESPESGWGFFQLSTSSWLLAGLTKRTWRNTVPRWLRPSCHTWSNTGGVSQNDV